MGWQLWRHGQCFEKNWNEYKRLRRQSMSTTKGFCGRVVGVHVSKLKNGQTKSEHFWGCRSRTAPWNRYFGLWSQDRKSRDLSDLHFLKTFTGQSFLNMWIDCMSHPFVADSTLHLLSVGIGKSVQYTTEKLWCSYHVVSSWSPTTNSTGQHFVKDTFT